MSYNQTLTASGGQTPYSWTNISGGLPPGLSLATNGIISGTPTTNGTFNFTVGVTDATNSTASLALTLTVIATNNLLLNGGFETGDFTDWTLSGDISRTFVDDGSRSGFTPHSGSYLAILGTSGNLGYISQTLSTTPGTSYLLSFFLKNRFLDPVSFLVSWNGNALFNVTNYSISGWGYQQLTATATGLNTIIQIGFEDDFQEFALDDISVVTLGPAPLSVTTTSLPTGVDGFFYGQQLSALSGHPPYSWSLISGSLPPGLTLAANGLISGMPTTNGAFNFSVQVTDATSRTATQPLTLRVGSPPSATITPANSSVAIPVGSGVSFGVSVTGTGPFSYLWQFYGSNLPNGIIVTAAGGYLGNGVPATNASLSSDSGVAVDSKGNLFVADYYNNVIREVGTNGIITTVAGNGVYGYSGDGGPATSASLAFPSGVAVDASGNLFFADSGNSRIRKVSPNGVITTVAGGGSNYFGNGGPATNAVLGTPSGVAVDVSGNLFIAEPVFVRKVSANGLISMVAGGGTNYPGNGGLATNASLVSPSGVAVDANGNLFIADRYHSLIREVGTNGIITTVAGNGISGYSGNGGLATNASLYNPSGVAVDARGNLFIADRYNNLIREVGTNGIITTVAGNRMSGYSGDSGLATNASLANPSGVAVDISGNLFITDNIRIREVGTNGIINTAAGGYFGNRVPATNAILTNPLGVAVDVRGDLFIADSGNDVVREVDTYGVITTIAGNRVAGYSGDGGLATNASLHTPSGVAVDVSGNLFIADSYNTVIREVDTNGIITTVAGGGASQPGDGGLATNASLAFPSGVVVDGNGNLFIADAGSEVIRKVSANAVITTVAGNGTNSYTGDGGPATNASLASPSGMAVDVSGNLFIADFGNNVIREVGTNGIITTMAGNEVYGYSGDGGPATNASLASPSGVAVDANGNLFIADSGNNVIREVDINGTITTMSGNGVAGYSGDGGAATNAELWNPVGVAVDANGNEFIADAGNNRIREVSLYFLSSTLILNDVGFGNAGAYDVVVSNPYGSVTSSVVNLTITLPAIVLSTPQITVGNNSFAFQLSGPSGSSYVLQVSTNLVNWSSVSTSAIPVSGSITLSNAIGGSNRRFYRVYLP